MFFQVFKSSRDTRPKHFTEKNKKLDELGIINYWTNFFLVFTLIIQISIGMFGIINF